MQEIAQSESRASLLAISNQSDVDEVNYLSMDGLYINEDDRYSHSFMTDFHRSNSMAAQREVRRMSLHPFSREQKLRQIEMLHLMATISKEKSNAERSKQLT